MKKEGRMVHGFWDFVIDMSFVFILIIGSLIAFFYTITGKAE